MDKETLESELVCIENDAPHAEQVLQELFEYIGEEGLGSLGSSVTYETLERLLDKAKSSYNTVISDTDGDEAFGFAEGLLIGMLIQRRIAADPES